MIEPIRKLSLIALETDRDSLLNALSEAEAAEIALAEETEGTVPLPESGEEIKKTLAEAEAALEILKSKIRRYEEQHKIKEPSFRDGIQIEPSRFAAAGERKEETEALIARINALWDEENSLKGELSKEERAIAAASPFEILPLPFSAYTDTAHVCVRLGSLPSANFPSLKKAFEEMDLAEIEGEERGEETVVVAAAHRSVFQEAENLLVQSGFTSCPYTEGVSGKEYLNSFLVSRQETEKKLENCENSFYELRGKVEDLEIFCDYVRFQLEKAQLSPKLRGTERTFLLKAYVPADREEEVKRAIEKTSGAVVYEFEDPGKEEEIPTVMRNRKIVENFETITNMYSVPDARELDPNTVMSFFYSVFLGFIMADVGYGLLMLLGGGFLYRKNRDKTGGIKSLAGVFAVGGVFAIIWGFLFNSFLGIAALPFMIMPDPQSQMYHFIGISIPGVLIVSLLLGVVQLMAGYLCKAAQFWRKGKFFDGLWEGGVWALFSLGVEIAMIGLIEEFRLSFLAGVGGIIAGVSLVAAVFTAGRHERLLGKFTKGFGALYGLINYFTDVLSYIRLYGLMLTGAVIAQIISQYGVQFLTSGSVLIVLGVLLMVAGHVFNLAIGLLGAYIHDARLQYVEFFGRFYIGEGRLFSPLGSSRKYVELKK